MVTVDWHGDEAHAARVIREMVAFGAGTRGELCRRLGVSKALVSRVTARLLDAGLLSENGQVRTTGPGRNAASLAVQPDTVYLVGADLEGLALRVCLLDAARTVRASRRTALNPRWSMERVTAQWAGLIGQVIRDSGIDTRRIAGLGLGLPGVVSPESLRIRSYLPPGRWVDMDIGRTMSAFGLPVTAANNTLCVTEYERRVGLTRDVPVFLSILVRYGIGAAIVAHGRFLTGDEIFTSELGHMRIQVGGPRCVCGRQGCLDVFCSGRTLPGPQRRRGPAWTRELRRRSRYLGVGLANLLKTVHAPLVVLNGVYNAYGDTVRPALSAALAGELAGLGLPAPRVILGEPVEFKTGIGAALRAADHCLEARLLGGVLGGGRRGAR